MVTKHAKFGPVQVHFREDGTLSIYQPDHNHVLSADAAEQLTQFLAEGLGLTVTRKVTLAEIFPSQTLLVSTQPTVPDGVICTSEGPVTPAGLTDTEVTASGGSPDALDSGLSETELEADKNAAEARAALAQSTPDPKPTTVAKPPVADDSSHSRESVPVVKRRPGRPRKATP